MRWIGSKDAFSETAQMSFNNNVKLCDNTQRGARKVAIVEGNMEKEKIVNSKHFNLITICKLTSSKSSMWI
ncbi:CLUMA_CG004709, isoform A [Clunio marinus]|uniref:CLUMA_CG004709, isoform A n=1 Tax=Clunio marinus TaxID=568069 RepID=A0A1J1HSP1_9DIPT|nr:CLUMA_CG004709, isoform A [Clunio marinus]